MKKFYLLVFCSTLFNLNNITRAQCTVDYSTSTDDCSGSPQTVRFTYSGQTSTGCGVTYAWNFGDPASGGANTSAAQNPTHAYSTPGNYNVQLQVTWAGGLGCGLCGGTNLTITKVVNVATKPNVAFTSTAPQCANTDVDFTNTSNNTGQDSLQYSWDFGADASPRVSVAANPAGIKYATSGTKTVVLRITNAIGCSNTSTQTITIKETPVANFTSTAPKCTGLTVDFTNTGTSSGASYLWDLGAGANPPTSIASDPTNVDYSTPGSKIIKLTTTNSISGCSVTDSQTINIYETPVVSFTSTAPQCTNVGIDFSNTGNSGSSYVYSWDFGNDASPATSSIGNPIGVSYSTSGSKTVTFKITTSEGCSDEATQTFTIAETPVAGFSSTGPKCTNDTIEFINTGTSSGVSYSWNLGTGASPATSTVQNLLKPAGANGAVIYSTAGPKLITQILTNTVTGCADTAVSTININLTPTATFVSTTAPTTTAKCVGVGVDFINTGNSGGLWSYAWDLGADATPKTSSSENPASVRYAGGGNKTVTFTVYDVYCSKTSTQIISISPLPIANAGPDTVICANTSVQIGTTGIVGNTYHWFPTSTLNAATSATPAATPIAPQTQYIVTVTNLATGCVNYDTAIVTMLAPIKADAGTDVTICRFDEAALPSRTLGYDEVQIGASLIQGQIYQWTPTTGILTSATSPNPYVSPDSTTTYTVTVWGSRTTSNLVCGPETDVVTVTVHQLPLANAGVDDTITVGASKQLIATGGLQYNWRPSYGLDNIGINTPMASPENTMNYIVRVTDVYGCIKEDTVLITVIEPSVWVPNAFTPNGDGKSDVFIVRGNGISEFEFGVFNRWGEQVFYTKSMDTGWDGTRAVTGEPLPAGAYVYYFKGVKSDGEVVNRKGMVNLIR